ncbi:hypothetical protein V6Z11_D01G071100 [Gossypium hirsutum]
MWSLDLNQFLVRTSMLNSLEKEVKLSYIYLHTHNRHCHTRLGRVLEIGHVSPSKGSINIRGKAKEPKLHFQVSKAVIRRYFVVVNPVIFFGHWNYIHHNLCCVLQCTITQFLFATLFTFTSFSGEYQLESAPSGTTSSSPL